MFKVLPVAAFVAVMSLSPAYAAGECTDAHMAQMDKMIAEMTDAAAKKEATMHLALFAPSRCSLAKTASATLSR